MGTGGVCLTTLYTDGVLQSVQGQSTDLAVEQLQVAWVLGNQKLKCAVCVHGQRFTTLRHGLGQPTAAQIQQASITITQNVAARGVPIAPPSTPYRSRFTIHTVGDSITCFVLVSSTT